MSYLNASPTIIISRRPKRDTVINKEDVINLKIALETSSSFEDFLRKV